MFYLGIILVQLNHNIISYKSLYYKLSRRIVTLLVDFTILLLSIAE
jgi:hypothetical protein